MKGTIWVLAGFLILILVSGCGKKKTPEAHLDQAVSEAVPAELPELEQNKVHMINPIVSGEQDTSFEPVASEQEELSAEEQALLGPPLD